MKSLTYITISVFLLAFYLKPSWNIPSIESLSTTSSSALVCPNPCQLTDSLALIAIYNATGGPAWMNTWNTSTPVCTPWSGVELDDEGYVVRLTLNSNNLIGNLPPEIGDFSRLEELQFDNNNLSGTIPPEIGNLTELKICFLDNNDFIGTVPEELGNLGSLNTLYLDNNRLTGAIPNTFTNLTNLFRFDLFNNQIDSIPNLSGIFLQPNKFRIFNNQVTFDDIVVQNLTALGTNYHPQDSVNAATTVNLMTGQTYVLDLGFDSGLTDNVYQWYRDGVLYGAPSNSNQLVFDPVGWGAAGVYRCQVTNPRAPLLTLHTRAVTINVSCGSSVFQVNDTLCFGDEIEINSIIYDIDNRTGFEVLFGEDQYGCDSLIIVELAFRVENVVNFEPILCVDDTVIVNGTVYDFFNPTGTEILSGADQYGCDSTIQVDLSFYTSTTSGTLNPIICPGDSIELFGTIFHAGNTSETIILENLSAAGCDSTLLIEIAFYPEALGNYNPSVCQGGSIDYEGIIFDADNPNGQVNLGPVAEHGCDSLVDVSLSFFGPIEGTYERTLCAGDSVIINGVTYNESNPIGTEFFPNAGLGNCDSTVFINLFFASTITEFINETLCPNDSIVVNGTTYNADNANGNEMISGGSSNGCDSTVVVNLSFYPENETINAAWLCPTDSIVINGTPYNVFNPNGTEVLTGASVAGCDSTIIIDLNFYPPAIETIDAILCPGDSIMVNGVVYNEANPSGTEFIENGTVNGCDSTISIDLTFFNEINITLTPTICREDSLVVNNTVYDVDHSSGTEIISSGTGCDSTININLSFYPNDPGFIRDTLCAEQGILVNGTFYNQANPRGTEVLEDGSVFGCDSTVIIELTFIQTVEGIFNPTLCVGDSVVINGVVYNESNPTGIQFFENEAASGCDSLVRIDLSYYIDIPEEYAATLCPGDSVVVNGTTYNEVNPSGTEILAGATINGCDSTVIVDLDFYPVSETLIDAVLCEGETIMVNGQTYSIDNPNGTEVLLGASSTGCDSTVVIDLTFNENIEETITATLCSGDSLMINGSAYHQGNPSGTEIIALGASNGCDSILIIELSFYPEIIATIDTTLCAGAVFEYEGITFDQDMPTGTVILEGASYVGCDSLVQVELSFYDSVEFLLQQTLCTEESLTVGTDTYDIDNPEGVTVLTGASSTGCDSIVTVQLTFYTPALSTYSPIICSGDSVEVNGTMYYQGFANGTELLENGSINGCDSIIEVSIDFYDPISAELMVDICAGSTYELAGQTFSESGTYDILFENASVLGCDSILTLELMVLDAETLGPADAGEDRISCENFLTLEANQPAGSTGRWICPEGYLISDPENAVIELEDLEAGIYTFIWTLSRGQCADYDSDTIKVNILASPDAVDDMIMMDAETNTLEIDVLENDQLDGVEAWTFELLNRPADALMSELEEGVYQIDRPSPLEQSFVLEYQLCNEDCPNLCSIATTTIILEKQDIDDLDIPNAITPNGDGVNEQFMFPHLEFQPDRYPDKELIIFNRWGNIVYEARPYQNDWGGVDQSGNLLPQGTYYFVLRLDISNGIILKGDVSILK